jgi:predicted nucleic acid-binding Zn ribbon protein
MRKLKPRQCRRCGRQFTPHRRHQRYHDRACRLAARSSRRNHQRWRQRSELEQASFRASFTATPDAVCVVCGTGMYRGRATRRYCSNACRQRAKRRRVPSAAQLRAYADALVARAHAKIETHRRQRLVLAASRGDPAAIEELAKLK